MVYKQKHNKYSSPYYKMRQNISALVRPKRGIVFVLAITIIFGCLITYYHFRTDLVYNFSLFLNSTLCFGSFMFCLLIAYVGLGYGISDDKIIDQGLQFIEINHYTQFDINNIKDRSGIIGGISPVKSFIPLLAIPIAFSALQDVKNVDLNIIFLFGAIIMIFLLPISLDTYYANIDGLILHTVAEYEYVKHKNQIDQTNNDLLVKLFAGALPLTPSNAGNTTPTNVAPTPSVTSPTTPTP